MKLFRTLFGQMWPSCTSILKWDNRYRKPSHRPTRTPVVWNCPNGGAGHARRKRLVGNYGNMKHHGWFHQLSFRSSLTNVELHRTAVLAQCDGGRALSIISVVHPINLLIKIRKQSIASVIHPIAHPCKLLIFFHKTWSRCLIAQLTDETTRLN